MCRNNIKDVTIIASCVFTNNTYTVMTSVEMNLARLTSLTSNLKLFLVIQNE